MRVSLSLKVLALALGVLLVSATPHEKDMPEPIGEVAEEPADEHAPDLNAEPDAHEPVAHKTGPGPKVNVTDPINVDHDQTVDHAEKDAARAADVDAGEREHDYYNQTGTLAAHRRIPGVPLRCMRRAQASCTCRSAARPDSRRWLLAPTQVAFTPIS